MAAPYTQKSDLDADVQVYYNKQMLETLLPKTVYYNHCDKQLSNVPTHAGQVVEFDRYQKLAPTTTALPATSDANGVTVTRDKIRATLAEYGAYTLIPKVVSVSEIDSLVEGRIKNTMANHAAETYDVLVREVMISTAQEVYANGKTSANIAGTDKATAADIKKLAAKLRQDDVMPFEKDGADSLYHFIGSAAQIYDIKADTTTGGFIDINKYHNSDALRKGFDGRGLAGVIDGVALWQTSLTKAETVNSVSCHDAIVLGHQAYACPEIDAAKMNVTVTPPQQGLSDVYGRFTLVGWYGLFVPVSLDDDAASSKNKRAIVYRSAYTAL